MTYEVEVYRREEGWIGVLKTDSPSEAIGEFLEYAERGEKTRITAEEGD